MKNLKHKLFPLLIAISALSVSTSAAFYSVSGLSKLFAGATLAVIIMATSLEVAKLVIASLLYQYRETLPRLLKYYLTTAAVVLVLITSMGIYGFLSSAYQETASKAGTIDAQIALIETKRNNIKEQLDVYNNEKNTINSAVADLRAGLANNVIQYKDKEGNLITTTSSATRKALEKQLDQAIIRQTEVNSKVDGLNEQLFSYETEIVEISTNSELAGELGPLKYLSGLTGIPMDKIINYLLLTIIFVFDPLAIALVIAANFAFEKLRPKTRENIYGEEVIIPDDDGGSDIYTEDELKDWDSTLADGLEEEIIQPEPFNIGDVDRSLLFEGWKEGKDFDEINPNYTSLSLEDKQQLEKEYLNFLNPPLVQKSNPIISWDSRKLSYKTQSREDDLTIKY